MIDKNRTYKTRDGREVRIYATDGEGEFSVHGAVNTNHGWCCLRWRPDGSYGHSPNHSTDLVEVKPRITGTIWLNVYAINGLIAGEAWHSKEAADNNAAPRRIDCICVPIDVEDKS